MWIPLSIFSEATRVFLVVDPVYHRLLLLKACCSVYGGGKRYKKTEKDDFLAIYKFIASYVCDTEEWFYSI